MENLVENQENRGLAAAAGGGGRGRSKAAAGGFAAVSSRPALGKELLFSILSHSPSHSFSLSLSFILYIIARIYFCVLEPNLWPRVSVCWLC